MKFQPVIITTKKDSLDLKEIKKILNLHLNLDILISELNTKRIDSSGTSIGIKDVNDIAEFMNFKNDGVKFVIIESAEKLTTEAQNSLLKVLEEPSENTLILLLSKNVEILLPTIRSRSLNIDLNDEAGGGKVYEITKLVKEFLMADYLNKLKISDQMVKEEKSREEICIFINELMRDIKKTQFNLDVIEFLKQSYVGMKRGTNMKLTLETISIMLSGE